MKPDIQGTLQKKNDNQTSLEQERNNILKSIEDTEVSIIEKVKELSSNAKSKACGRYDDLKEDLQEEISTLLQGITNMDELKNEVETQKESDRNRKFVRYILQKRSITQTQIMHDSVGKDERKIKCFMNNELIRRISTTDCFAHIVGSKSSLDSKTKPVHKVSQKEVNIKTNGDKETCSIYGICQLHDGTIILADHTNKKLKRMNGEFFITEELDLESNPMGLCLTDNREVALKLKNDRIILFSVDEKFKAKYSIHIEGGNHIGLVYFYNELWCCSDTDIRVYDRSGTVLKTLCNKSFKDTAFETTAHYLIPVAASDEFVLVSDLVNRVACLGRDGNVLSVLKSERLKLVRRACVAENGIIFLAGFKSKNIMMFNENGKCLGELAHGLDRPDALCYDSKSNQLIVGHKNKNTLTVITTGESSQGTQV